MDLLLSNRNINIRWFTVCFLYFTQDSEYICDISAKIQIKFERDIYWKADLRNHIPFFETILFFKTMNLKQQWQ